MNKILKDNPVPSIDKDDIEFLKWINRKFLNSNIRIKNIISKLQNGVETDNGQPKKELLKHCCGAQGFGQGINDKCPACDAMWKEWKK